MNIFHKDIDTIVRRMNPLDTYPKLAISYMMKRYSISEDKAREILKAAIDQKGFDDPIVEYYHKDKETLDKSRKSIRLSRYLSSITDEQLTIAPSFTCYNTTKYDGSKWFSTHSKLMDRNKELRNKHKKLAKIAKSKKDFVEMDIQNTIQATKKIANNAYSGGACQLHLPFATHSSHYTFTSTTRIVTSTANVLSESILSGYRLYLRPEDVLNHMVTLIKYSDIDRVKMAIEHYNLHIPSVTEVMDMVKYNIYYFWDNQYYLNIINEYVYKLSDAERATIVYTYDLFHIIKYNKDSIENILYEASIPKVGISSDLSILDKAESYKLNIIYHILSDELVNKGLDHHAHKGTPLADKMVSTMVNLNRQFDKLKILVDVFFKGEVFPPNVEHFKDVPRKAIGLSDTDSTVSVQSQLVRSKFGHTRLTPATIGYTAILGSFVSESIVGTLVSLSVNMNLLPEKRTTLAMKSEFFFPFLAPSTASKHYLSLDMIEEMLIKENEPIVFHGVSLISAKITEENNEFKKRLATRIAEALTKGIKVNPISIIKEVKDLENRLEEKIFNLDPSILVYSEIKDSSAYSSEPEKSPYFHHIIWNSVYAPKYGKAPEPPYISVNIPLTTNTKSKMNDFINRIESDDIRERYINVLKRLKKSSLATFRVPLDLLADTGIPDELVPIIDSDKLILSQTASIRLVMVILGIPIKDNVLVRDTY